MYNSNFAYEQKIKIKTYTYNFFEECLKENG